MLAIQQPVTIRFEDADPAGVVFYPRAIALAHAAVEDLVRQSTVGWDVWFNSPVHAAPLRRAEADFFLPMKPGQRFVAQAMVEQIGDTSVTFLVTFTDETGRLAARVRTVHVLIDKTSGRPRPLDENMRRAFAGTGS
jgi:acyl-CoA thioesterase FadM